MSMLILSIIAPFVLAKQRKTYLTDFIISNRIGQSGFSNSDDSSAFSYEATMGGLEILGQYELYEVPGDWGAIIDNVNLSQFQSALSSKITTLLDRGDTIIYDLAYLLRSLELVGYDVTSKSTNIEAYMGDTIQAGGGFSPLNSSSLPTIISTYFGVKIYSMIGELETLNRPLHISWILNCRNADGGYGGNSSLPSTIINTYYAVLAVELLGTLDDVTSPALTATYLDSFYVVDINDVDNSGGYLPDSLAYNALISSTYYCTKIISLLDNTLLHAQNTTNWIIHRQNFEDGGFAENSDGNIQKSSSITTSYYAFETLKVFEAELESLNENIWMVEFNLFILIVILSVIGVGIVILIGVWRKKRL